MEQHYTFEKFINRVVITANLEAVTPIFVGARDNSFMPGAISGACVKDAKGQPYIPGSSLKGVLRAFLASIRSEESDVENKYKTKEQRDKCSGGDAEKLARDIAQESTTVQRLFGSTVMAGKIKIADATLKEAVKPEIRNGVAIDRDTHTALGGALFDTEVVPSGTVFTFRAMAENLSDSEAELFGKLLDHFAQGNIAVGGRSRAGLGMVKLCDAKVAAHRAEGKGFPKEEKIDCKNDNISIGEAVRNVCKVKM